MIIPCRAMTLLWIWLFCCCFEATSSFVHSGDVSMKNFNGKVIMLLDSRRKQACCCCCPRQATQVLAPSSSNKIRSARIRTSYLSCQKNDNGYEDETASADDDEFVDVYDSSPVGEKDFDLFLPMAGFAILFVAFWPLLAVIGNPDDPTSGFDIDMFMSLKSIIDSSSISSSSNAQQAGDIVELPSLSPGERIVDVFFGLPTTRSFGDF